MFKDSASVFAGQQQSPPRPLLAGSARGAWLQQQALFAAARGAVARASAAAAASGAAALPEGMRAAQL